MKTLCLLFLAALLPAQQPREAAAGTRGVSPEMRADLAARMPVPASFGFKPKGPAAFYSSDLKEYLGAAAAAYLDYGLAGMVHQAYQAKGSEVTVDIHDMGTQLNAFGIYSAERPADCRYLEIASEAYTKDKSLNFFQAHYYVKITDAGGSVPLLETVAKYISRKIWTDTTMPAEISWLPPRGLVPHTQKYLVRSPMGRDFLAPAAMAVYRFNGKDTTVLVSRTKTPADAAALVARLKQSFAGAGGATALAGAPAETWRASAGAEGELLFFAKGRDAVLLAHPPAQPLPLLKDIVSRIPN